MSALESNLKSMSLKQREGNEEDTELSLEDVNHNKEHKVKGKHNKHIEPFVLSDEALFMWPEIASFCPPEQVIALETVCTKIRQTLADASVGTRLMNRYWNAQWARLIWGDDEDNVHDGNDDNNNYKKSNDNVVDNKNNKNESNNISISDCNEHKNGDSICNNEKEDSKDENNDDNDELKGENEDTSINLSTSSDANNTKNNSRSNSGSSPRESSQRNSIKLVMISRDKKLLLSSSLSHSEGRKDWRTMYRKEYPNWIVRTFRGVGIRNNLASEDRARLLHDRGLNEIKTAAQLAREELTVEEALIKKLRKRGITIEIPNSNISDKKPTRNNRNYNGDRNNNNNNNNDSPTHDKKMQTSEVSSPVKLRGFKNASPVFGPAKGNSKSVNDLVSLPITTSGNGNSNYTSAGVKAEDKQLTRVAKRYAATREAGSPLTRDDYLCDKRQGARKGKHAKGMPKRWASYNEFGDYDY